MTLNGSLLYEEEEEEEEEEREGTSVARASAALEDTRIRPKTRK